MRQLEVKDSNVKYVGPGNTEQDAAAIRCLLPVLSDPSDPSVLERTITYRWTALFTTLK